MMLMISNNCARCGKPFALEEDMVIRSGAAALCVGCAGYIIDDNARHKVLVGFSDSERSPHDATVVEADYGAVEKRAVENLMLAMDKGFWAGPFDERNSGPKCPG